MHISCECVCLVSSWQGMDVLDSTDRQNRANSSGREWQQQHSQYMCVSVASHHASAMSGHKDPLGSGLCHQNIWGDVCLPLSLPSVSLFYSCSLNTDMIHLSLFLLLLVLGWRGRLKFFFFKSTNKLQYTTSFVALRCFVMYDNVSRYPTQVHPTVMADSTGSCLWSSGCAPVSVGTATQIYNLVFD